MIGHLLRKGKRFAHQPTTALAQGIIEPLDLIGLATVLPNRTMPLRWQDGGIRLPKIGRADGTLAIDCWQRCPQFARGRFTPRPNRHAHNVTRVAIDGQPDPFLAPFCADKRPQFVALQN